MFRTNICECKERMRVIAVKSGIILAAGLSSRMGNYKPLTEINGKKLIDWTVDSMFSGGVKDVIVVTGYRSGDIQEHLVRRYQGKVRWTVNEDYRNGRMFDSVKCGLRVLGETEAVYLLPGDMPAISPKTFFLLDEKRRISSRKIFLPTVGGSRKHPPLVAADMVKYILSYQGEEGLRGFWKKAEALIEEVECDDAGCTLDVDTPEDLKEMERYLQDQKKRGDLWVNSRE